MEHITKLLDSLDALIYVSDMENYEILYINQHGRRLWGDVTGNKCYEALQKNQDGPCPFCTNHLLLNQSGEPVETVVWEFQNTLTGLWYQCRDSAIRWSNGKMVRLEIATDITARKRTESQIIQLGNLKERLLGTQPYMDKLQDITESALQIFDIDLACIWLFHETYYTLESSEILSGSVFLEPEDEKPDLHLIVSSSNGDIAAVPVLISPSREFKESKEEYVQDELAHHVYTKGLCQYLNEWAKNRRLYSSRPFPLIDENSKTIGYMDFFRKSRITDEEQHLMTNLVHIASQVIISTKESSELTRTKEKYRLLVENLPQGVYLKDKSLRYISCNSQFADDLGVSIDEIVGKRDTDLFPDSITILSTGFDGEIIRFKTTEKKIHEYTRNNSIRWIESIRTPLIDNKGNFSGVLGILHDITEIKNAQKELECLYNELEERVKIRTEELFQTQEAYHKANRKLNLLNSITRHDILNQISALYGYLGFIEELTTDETINRYLKRAELAAEMIHEQILFTRLYQDIGVHAPVWQQVQEIVETTLSGFKTELRTSSVELKNLKIYADPLLEKVFYTLIDNSIRHGQRVSEIHFGTRYEEDTLIIWYEDNGVGIALEDKERIFERGYGQNTGMGLFLAKEILNITGLSIRENGIPGNGARFEIMIQKYAYQKINETVPHPLRNVMD